MNAHAVIAGIGLRTSIGATREAVWNAVCGGRPKDAVQEEEAHPSPLAAAQRHAAEAVDEALVHAGLYRDGRLGVDAARVACTFSASKPLFRNCETSECEAPERVAEWICARFGVHG